MRSFVEPTNDLSLSLEFKVAEWLEHPTSIVGSIQIWNSEFFSEFLSLHTYHLLFMANST